MRKNTLYLAATLVALIIIMLITAPKKEVTDNSGASPINGLMPNTPPPSVAKPTRSAATSGTQPAVAPVAAPSATGVASVPESNAALPPPPKDTVSPADDVPAGAEVSGDTSNVAPSAMPAPATSAPAMPTPTAARDKGTAIPPSEGR